LKVAAEAKEQQIQKRRIYEILNESAVQTRENYDKVQRGAAAHVDE